MELKLLYATTFYEVSFELLIVPYGIETLGIKDRMVIRSYF